MRCLCEPHSRYRPGTSSPPPKCSRGRDAAHRRHLPTSVAAALKSATPTVRRMNRRNNSSAGQVWLSPNEVAAQLHISRATLYRLWERHDGMRYACITGSGHRRVRQDWLDDWARGREAA